MSFKIGIDATNIKAGGGLKVLLETFNTDVDPRPYGISELLIYGGKQLDQITNHPWITKRYLPELDKSFLFANLWKTFKLKSILKSECDLIYCPGGSFPSKELDYIFCSQNMLVFEKKERNRFPLSKTRLRYTLLNIIQKKGFKYSKGNIFITEHSKGLIQSQVPVSKGKPFSIIPYGATTRFKQEPKPQLEISNYTQKKPFKILYVSIVNFYKHQWQLAKAVKILREEGFPLELDLIGPAYPAALPKLENEIKGAESYIHYLGKIPYDVIEKYYQNADLYMFGSTCETMPNVLVEAMSAGLPIVSSDYGPMKEILKDGGVYMDPLKVDTIVEALRKLIENSGLRSKIAAKAFNYAQEYTWEKTSKMTFEFLAKFKK